MIELTAFGIPNMMSAIVLSLVAQHLARRNPVAVLIPEDISAAKQSFDLHEPTVKVGTIHSAKGLDFEVVGCWSGL